MRSFLNRPAKWIGNAVMAAMLCMLLGSMGLSQQTETAKQAPHFRVGEKLSYSISFNRQTGAGTAELYVASRGKLAGRDVIELRSRARTVELINAAFLPIDENRTVYAEPDTGNPVYSIRTSNAGIPRDVSVNYLRDSSPNLDILTMIYRARENAGAGTYTFLEGDQVHTATFVPSGAAKITTEAGTYDVIASSVESDFLAMFGVSGLVIYFSTDPTHMPVEFRFKTARGAFKVSLSAIALPEPEPAPLPTATPTRSPVPTPTRTPPRPTPTPAAPYVENQPLAPELGFRLGENLNYRLTMSGKAIGTLSVTARERKLFQRSDSLLLTATITSAEPGVTTIHPGDSVSVQVDPETLAPTWYEGKFPGGLAGLNVTASLDKQSGDIKIGNRSVEAPIGTHTILSLLYAMRSFNLKPSQDRSNPVNDTRVAVFWETKPYIFTLRPSNPADIMTIDGRKVSAQLISVKTENAVLDALNPKVWLGTDDRVPLRFSFGAYTGDLIIPQAEFPTK